MYCSGWRVDGLYVVHDPAVNYDSFNYSFPPLRDQMISPQVVPESGWKKEFRHHDQGDEVVVPPGKLFFKGDNGDRGSDRPPSGYLARDPILGRPFCSNATSEAH